MELNVVYLSHNEKGIVLKNKYLLLAELAILVLMLSLLSQLPQKECNHLYLFPIFVYTVDKEIWFSENLKKLPLQIDVALLK